VIDMKFDHKIWILLSLNLILTIIVLYAMITLCLAFFFPLLFCLWTLYCGFSDYVEVIKYRKIKDRRSD